MTFWRRQAEVSGLKFRSGVDRLHENVQDNGNVNSMTSFRQVFPGMSATRSPQYKPPVRGRPVF